MSRPVPPSPPAIAFVLLGLMACGDSVPPAAMPDVADAGSIDLDTGPTCDTECDAGCATPPCSEPFVDAGPLADAAPTADTGLLPDTGPRDAGAVDCPRDPSFDADPRFDGLLARIQAHLSSSDDTRPSGASVAIVEDGRLVSAAGLGFRGGAGQPGATESVDEHTLFWAASTSKWVNAMAALTLVDEGILELDAPITTHLTAYSEDNGRHERMTLDHLLKMKSGLEDDTTCRLWSNLGAADTFGCGSMADPRDEVLQNLFAPETLGRWPWNQINLTTLGAPGDAPWFYSNYGIMLSGRVLEVASGQSYSAIVRRRVLEPAEMCTATYDPEAVLAYANYALGTGVSPIDGRCLETNLGHDSAQPFYPDELACPARMPNGGLWASAIDLGRLAASFVGDVAGNERVLSASSANLLLAPTTGRASTGLSRYDTYGYGNFHHTVGGHDVYSHGGNRPGFSSVFWVSPERGFAIAILANHRLNEVFWQDAEYAIRCYLNGGC